MSGRFSLIYEHDKGARELETKKAINRIKWMILLRNPIETKIGLIREDVKLFDLFLDTYKIKDMIAYYMMKGDL